MTFENCWYIDSCPKCPQECCSTCLRYAEMINLMQLSNLPEHKWFSRPLTPGQDILKFRRLKDIKDDIEYWVKSGNNLYLYSKNFGNGKTSWAIKLMLAYFNEVWAGNGFRRRGVFISVPEFIDRGREIINNRDEVFVLIKQDIINCDLVIWDDIASVKLTDYNYSLFLNYLDARVSAGKANIFTGNVDEPQMREQLGGRITSRIYNISEVIEFTQPDKRGTQ